MMILKCHYHYSSPLFWFFFFLSSVCWHNCHSHSDLFSSLGMPKSVVVPVKTTPKYLMYPPLRRAPQTPRETRHCRVQGGAVCLCAAGFRGGGWGPSQVSWLQELFWVDIITCPLIWTIEFSRFWSWMFKKAGKKWMSVFFFSSSVSNMSYQCSTCATCAIFLTHSW